ncbi:MAG TPA: hypothetical protein VN455_02885 [Methanotrichaceae archaeon]|nr:hypothetical protein [Methanotrichaceae archaeon]
MVGFVLISLALASLQITCLAVTDDSNGNWSQKSIVLRYTPEADLMARTGDIDNLNLGWPDRFDPFSGQSTPAHLYPLVVDPTDPQGTDRMMVVSSFNGHPSGGSVEYPTTTTGPENEVHPVILRYNISGIEIGSASLQIFVDGIQAPVFGARYQARLNGIRVPVLEDAINSLNQTGPSGKLISIPIPDEYLYLLSGGNLSVDIDDPETGVGDVFSVDFVKLLINPGKICKTCCDCCSAQIKKFCWVGADGDKVGREDEGSPDGVSDGHFVLDLCLPSDEEIRSISIYNTGPDGTLSDALPQHSSQVWHSSDPYWDILGVFYKGHQLNPHHISSLGSFSCNVRFDLYASDLGGFNSGNSYLVQVELGKLQKLTTI